MITATKRATFPTKAMISNAITETMDTYEAVLAVSRPIFDITNTGEHEPYPAVSFADVGRLAYFLHDAIDFTVRTHVELLKIRDCIDTLGAIAESFTDGSATDGLAGWIGGQHYSSSGDPHTSLLPGEVGMGASIRPARDFVYDVAG